MEISHIFTEKGTYQFEAHSDGTYSIIYKSNWNSLHDYKKDDLFFQDFLREYAEIIRKIK